ncbi:MAG: AI-2E family transporter [Coleofasciculaceae cyanobacterium SM2_3_26]|nr:AI-2E family transporter [Coleofasciculaceae cyanobacterium SM2_3_26]
MTQRITISLSNIVLFFATLLLLLLLWQLRSLLVILMISVVLATSIAPVVDWAERWRVPRWLSAVFVYLLLIAGLTGFGLLIGPKILEQIERLARQLPTFFDSVRGLVESFSLRLSDPPPEFIREFLNPQSLTNWVFRSGQQLVLRSYGITRGIVGAVFSLILSLFISGYIVADSKTLVRSITELFPYPWNHRLNAQAATITDRMGGYIRGRVIVSAILGLATTTGLTFLGLREFSLALGAIAGVTNLIPFLGPIIGAVPALVVASSQGWWTLLWVLILFVVIQNLETYVLDPLLVGTSVGVHPLYQLLSVLGGVQVLGIIGALIVPPWFAGASVLVENLYLKPKQAIEQESMQAAIAPADGLTDNTTERSRSVAAGKSPAVATSDEG